MGRLVLAAVLIALSYHLQPCNAQRQGNGNGCTEKADVLFIIDSSGSIDQTIDWRLLRSFVADVVRRLNVGTDRIRVAGIKYSTQAKLLFWLDQYKTSAEVIAAITGIKYSGHRTNIAGALELARKDIFIWEHGERHDAPNVAILITDGNSTVRVGEAIQEAEWLKQEGTKIIPVGITSAINMTELRGIASDPSQVLSVSNFTALSQLIDGIVEFTCQTEPPRTTIPVTEVDCPFKADIALLIDSSGSITYPTYDNWWKLLKFCETFIDSFAIGPDATQFALISFSTSVKLEFDLRRYTNKQDLINRLNQTEYIGDQTNIAGALRRARNEIFTSRGGDRSDATNIVVVVTDGNSNVEARYIKDEAEKIKAKKPGPEATVIAVGITSRVNQRQLEVIASDPDRDFIFRVTDFRALKPIVASVIARACQQATDKPISGRPPRPLTTLTPVRDCNNRIDVCIVMDASGSIKANNFILMKNFLEDLVEDLDVDRGNVRVGLVTFSDSAQVEFSLHAFSQRRIMIRAIRRVPYHRGTTNTAEAIRMARTEVFGDPEGDRADAQNIMIILTDGGSNKKMDTLKEAELARAADIHIISVGIGDWLNKIELASLASYPSSESVIFAPDFATLPTIRGQLRDTICAESKCDTRFNRAPCRNGRCIALPNSFSCECYNNYIGKTCQRRCRSKPEVVFLVDDSGSVGEVNFKRSLDFVYNMIDEMDGIRVGMATFSDDVKLNFNLEDFNSKQERLNALYTQYTGGTTNTAAALRFMTESMFMGRGGDKIGIVLTDGKSNDPDATWKEAAKAKNAGIHVIAIGVGSGATRNELEDMASSTNDVYQVDTFEELEKLQESLIKVMCNDGNECSIFPCRNGARCTDLRNGYTCGPCPFGFTGRNCERSCDGQSDLVFLIDASGSIRHERFGEVLDFAASIVAEMDVSPSRTRVAAASWSDDAHLEFQLDSYKTQYDVLRALKAVKFQGGRTNTASAIRMMRKQILVDTKGDRLNVPNYVIIITDGNSNVNSSFTVPEAIQARVEGSHIIIVSVGSDLRQVELDAMASSPASANKFSVSTIANLTMLTGSVIQATCDDQDECRSSPCRFGRCIDGLKRYICDCFSGRTGYNCDRSCSRQMDIVFLLDLSASTDSEYRMIVDFTREAIYNLDLSFDRVRVGIVTYSTDVKIQFHLNTYKGREEVLNAAAFFNEGGKTNTQKALNVAKKQMFTKNNGDRNGVPNIVVLVSDGDSNINTDNTQPMAEELRDEDAEIYVVGVGKNPRIGEINEIASDPDNTHVFYMEDASQVVRAADKLAEELCQ